MGRRTCDQPQARRFWLVWVLGVICFSAAAGGLLYRLELDSEIDHSSRQLAELAAMKAEEIRLWREERLADGMLTQAMDAMPWARDGIDRSGRFAWLEWLVRRPGFDAALLVDASGEILSATDEGPIELPPAVRDAVRSPAVPRAPWLSEVLRAGGGRFRIYLTVPIVGARESEPEYLIARFSPDRLVLPEGESLAGAPSAAEVKLGRREGGEVYSLVAGDGESGALMLRATQPLASARAHASELTGVVDAFDDRGSRVVAAMRPVPGTKWLVVAKLERRQVLLGPMFRAVVASAGMAVALGALLLAVAARQRRRVAEWYRRQYEAEKRERQTREAQARLLEVIEEAVFEIDATGTVTSWTPAAERMYGYSQGEALGAPVGAIVRSSLTAEQRKQLLDGAAARGRERAQATHARKSGGALAVETTVVPVRGEGGALSGFVCVTRDVSQRRRAEEQLRSLEARLVSADRMVSMGTLAAGVAHEMNNPLAYVMSNVGLALEEVRQAAPSLVGVVEALEDASEGCERVRDIVRDLKMFSRSPTEEPKFADAVAVIESSVKLARAEMRGRATLATDLQRVPGIEMSSHRLGQVVLNLLINAAHAIPAGAPERNEIRVACSHRGGRVEIEVSDTGCGIAPEHVSRIFEPFYTTKPSGLGTGLGLSICKEIVEAAHGVIAVESRPDRGTLVRVALPANAPAAIASPAATARQVGPTDPLHRVRVATGAAPGRRVLVVDDDPGVRRALERIVAEIGEAVCCEGAARALDELARGEFDVILCDLVMPGMTGMEFFERVAAVSPKTARRIVFVTGATGSARSAGFLESTNNRRIEKPFSRDDILIAIEAVVANGASEERSRPMLDPNRRDGRVGARANEAGGAGRTACAAEGAA